MGADIEAVCREAAIISLRKDMKSKTVSLGDFDKAFEKVKPSVTKEIEEAYTKLQDFFTQARGKQMQEEKPDYMG